MLDVLQDAREEVDKAVHWFRGQVEGGVERESYFKCYDKLGIMLSDVRSKYSNYDVDTYIDAVVNFLFEPENMFLS